VAQPVETELGGDRVETVFEVGFERFGDREVLDASAHLAHQMMVVFGEILGELVAGELVECDDPPDHAGALQHREVAVGRALREPRAGLEEFLDAQGALGGGEGGDDRPPTRGVALSVEAQTFPGGVVHVRHDAPKVVPCPWRPSWPARGGNAGGGGEG
jgi:hypothetical protein